MAKNTKLFDSILSFAETLNGIKENTDIDTQIKQSDIKSILERNKKYNKYIDNYSFVYAKKQKGQSKMKWIFFITVLALLVILVMGTIVSMVLISSKNDIDLYDISLIISAIAGVITSFIILPKVIAQNLFPSTDEDNSYNTFKSVIENDYRLREFYFNNFEKFDKSKKGNTSNTELHEIDDIDL